MTGNDNARWIAAFSKMEPIASATILRGLTAPGDFLTPKLARWSILARCALKWEMRMRIAAYMGRKRNFPGWSAITQERATIYRLFCLTVDTNFAPKATWESNGF